MRKMRLQIIRNISTLYRASEKGKMKKITKFRNNKITIFFRQRKNISILKLMRDKK